MQVFITGGGVAAVEGDLSGGSGYLVMIWGRGGVAGPGSRRRAKFKPVNTDYPLDAGYGL